jgi:hypothetical protein
MRPWVETPDRYVRLFARSINGTQTVRIGKMPFVEQDWEYQIPT